MELRCILSSMANTTPTPPFAKSAPPPPPLIVLLGNTDLICDPLPTLLSHEDLTLNSKHTHYQSNRARFHPYKQKESLYSFFDWMFFFVDHQREQIRPEQNHRQWRQPWIGHCPLWTAGVPCLPSHHLLEPHQHQNFPGQKIEVPHHLPRQLPGPLR